MEPRSNHFDAGGNAIMVDVSAKDTTVRTAVARGRITMSRQALDAVGDRTTAKGDVLGVARIAGIQAAKRTAELIPLCHPLALSHLSLDLSILQEECAVEARCTARTTGQTGVEMEALTGLSVALLTIYDMCKGMDRSMELSQIHLLHKDGGASGVYQRED